MLIFWDFAIIEHLAFILFFLLPTLIFVSCAQRVSSTRERSSRRCRDDSVSTSQKQNGSQVEVQTEKEMAVKRSEMSQKSRRGDTMDSIRIMRGRKPNRKPRDPKEMKPERSDSQHTEIINVPLGKAAKEHSSPSKLTEDGQKKEAEQGKTVSGGKRVQFAENLIKSSKTQTAPPPMAATPIPEKSEVSKKSKKSIKEVLSRKSKKGKMAKKKR
ncbi:Protein CBG25408 [Caenorhabditis briggsae]|uniref:Uncharacterized protein n=2 Tax=Caenorhabditis briggsae TaxID=6238 RepID=A0AAE9DY92_CAEBR|nr:Protein CBG25408 [Caenorhabditis briggsae]ULU13440.1 hypothetical protein L3Y34_016148 [Caenorhabditis briggsae]CAR99858.1 Protein CBG25408 [Caenorhabditis briggsae]